MMDPQKIKETFNFIGQHQGRLTEYQVSFIRGLQKYFTRNKTLSEKQGFALLEITRNLKVEVAVKENISVEPNNH